MYYAYGIRDVHNYEAFNTYAFILGWSPIGAYLCNCYLADGPISEYCYERCTFFFKRLNIAINGDKFFHDFSKCTWNVSTSNRDNIRVRAKQRQMTLSRFQIFVQKEFVTWPPALRKRNIPTKCQQTNGSIFKTKITTRGKNGWSYKRTIQNKVNYEIHASNALIVFI